MNFWSILGCIMIGMFLFPIIVIGIRVICVEIAERRIKKFQNNYYRQTGIPPQAAQSQIAQHFDFNRAIITTNGISFSLDPADCNLNHTWITSEEVQKFWLEEEIYYNILGKHCKTLSELVYKFKDVYLRQGGPLIEVFSMFAEQYLFFLNKQYQFSTENYYCNIEDIQFNNPKTISFKLVEIFTDKKVMSQPVADVSKYMKSKTYKYNFNVNEVIKNNTVCFNSIAKIIDRCLKEGRIYGKV